MAKVTNGTVNNLNSNVSKNTSAVNKNTTASKNNASASDKNTSAANKLDSTIKANTKASNSNASAVEQAANDISKAAGILKEEGINLTESIDSVKDEIQQLPEKWQEILQTIIEMNNKIVDLNTTKLENEKEKEEKKGEDKEEPKEGESSNPLEKEFESFSIDTSVTESSILSSSTTLPNLVGNGLSLIHNSLQQVVSTITDGFNQMTSVLVGNLNKINISKEAENAPKETNEVTPLKSSIAEFFNGLAGPLQSVASALLVVSLAAAVLNTLPLENLTISVAMKLFGFLTATFTALSLISLAYRKVAPIIDPEQQDNPDNLLNIIKQLSLTVLLIGATVAISVGVVTLLESNIQYVVAGLVMSFGVMFLSLMTLSLVSDMALPTVQEDSKPMQLMNDFSKMLITTSLIFLANALLYPIIKEGAFVSMAILGFIEISVLALMEMANEIAQQDPEALEQLNGMLVRITVLYGVMGLMVAVLGLIPTNVAIQGITTVAIISILVMSTIGMLVHSAKQLDKLNLATLEQLNTLIIATTVMIGLMSILVIALGLLPTAAVVQGVLAMTVIAALPIVLIKILSKVAQQSSQLVQALEGVVIASLISVATAGLAWLLITILGGFTIGQVLTTMATMGLMVVLFTVVTGAIVLLGTIFAALISGPQAALIPMAIVGIAIAGTVSLAIAGFAYLLMSIFKDENEAIQAQQAAKAIALTAVALTTIALTIVTIGALAIPMMIAMPLAITALTGLTSFINMLSAPDGILATLAVAASSIDISGVVGTVANITQLCIALATLHVPLALLALNAPLLLISLSICTTSMFLVSAGLVLLASSLKAIQSLEFVDVSPKVAELNNTIESLNGLAQAINNFIGIDLGKMLMVRAAVGYVASFEKTLGKIGNNGATEKITSLTNNLANLANTAPGLNALAEAIARVSAATSQLNQVQNSNAQSIERLTGQGLTENKFIQNPSLKGEPRKANTVDFDPIIEKLNKVVSGLESLRDAQESNNAKLSSLVVTMDNIGQRMSLSI